MSEDCERVTSGLISSLKGTYPEEYARAWEGINSSDSQIDIDETFVGFVDIYEALARIIPQGRTIYDIGCCSAFQSYFFRKHHLYVGVDWCGLGSRLVLPGSMHFQKEVKSLQDLLEIVNDVDDHHPSFAICSYVPDGSVAHAVKSVFTDCFVFYPHVGDNDSVDKVMRALRELRGVVNSRRKQQHA